MRDLIANRQGRELDCAVCRHGAVWSPLEAVERLGARTTFPQARARLVCSSCGTRTGDDGRISARPSISDYYDRLCEKGMGMPR
jgi:hypothetical protein